MAVGAHAMTNAAAPVCSWGSSSPALYFQWTVEEARPFIYMGTNYRYFTAPSAGNDNVYRCYTFIVPGSEQTSINTSQCYINKTELATQSTVATSAQAAKSVWYIGSGGTSNYLTGKLSWFAVYNRVLTEAEIFSNVDYASALLASRSIGPF